MKVIHRKHCEPAIYYREAKCGAAFVVPKLGTEVYIKSDSDGASGLTATMLSTGETYSFSRNTVVQLVNCEVVVG